MGWGYQVNVVAALVLQGQHDLGQLLVVNDLPLPLMTDIEILTKITQQVAVGKENGARTARPHQRALFAEMGAEAGYPCLIGSAADAGFTVHAIDLAALGAQHATA